MYKLSKGLFPPLISDIFMHKNSHSYNLRHNSQFSRPLVETVFRGTESISYLGSAIWDVLPVTYKELPSLEPVKNRVKKNGNLRTAIADFPRHTLVGSVLYKNILNYHNK